MTPLLEPMSCRCSEVVAVEDISCKSYTIGEGNFGYKERIPMGSLGVVFPSGITSSHFGIKFGTNQSENVPLN